MKERQFIMYGDEPRLVLEGRKTPRRGVFVLDKTVGMDSGWFKGLLREVCSETSQTTFAFGAERRANERNCQH